MNELLEDLSSLRSNLKTSYVFSLSTLNSEVFLKAARAYRALNKKRSKKIEREYREIFCNSSPLEFGQIFSNRSGHVFNRIPREELVRRLLSGVGGTFLLSDNDFSFLRAFSNDLSPPDNSFVIGWDFDSHQDVNSSIDFHSYCDLYFAAHNTYLDVLTELVGKVAYPLPLGSLQWRLEFLYSKYSDIWESDRSFHLCGEHGRYEHYFRRNYIVDSISSRHPNVFTNSNLNNHLYATETEKISYWLQSKVHFCYPTNFEVPLRVYDCGVTGSIAILPESSRYAITQQVANWKNFVVFCDPYFENSVSRAIEIALVKYKQLREIYSSSLQRSSFIRSLHVNQRLDQVFKFLNLTFEGPVND